MGTLGKLGEKKKTCLALELAAWGALAWALEKYAQDSLSMAVYDRWELWSSLGTLCIHKCWPLGFIQSQQLTHVDPVDLDSWLWNRRCHKPQDIPGPLLHQILRSPEAIVDAHPKLPNAARLAEMMERNPENPIPITHRTHRIHVWYIC